MCFHVFVVSAAKLFLYLMVTLLDVRFMTLYFPPHMFTAFLSDCPGFEAFLCLILDWM